MAFSDSRFCQLWGFAWNFICKFATHLVAMVSVLRAFRIIRPLSNMLTKNRVTGVIAVDFVFLLLMDLSAIFLGGTFSYLGAIGSCVPDFTADNIAPFTSKSIFLSYLPGLTYILPVPIILVSYLLSITSMVSRLRRRRVSRQHNSRIHFHLQSAMTMSTFVGVYLICNTPLAVYIASVVVKLLVVQESLYTTLAEPGWCLPYVTGLAYILGAPLNSTVNPLVCMTRMQDFRMYIISKISRRSRSVQNLRRAVINPALNAKLPVPRAHRRKSASPLYIRLENRDYDIYLGSYDLNEYETML